MKKVYTKFSYTENDVCSFLDDETYEEYRVPESKLKDWMHLLVVGFPCALSFYHNQFIAFQPPGTFEYNVVGMEGKVAVLDTGAKLSVPPFVQVGDRIQVQIEPLQYMNRCGKGEEK